MPGFGLMMGVSGNSSLQMKEQVRTGHVYIPDPLDRSPSSRVDKLLYGRVSADMLVLYGKRGLEEVVLETCLCTHLVYKSLCCNRDIQYAAPSGVHIDTRPRQSRIHTSRTTNIRASV